MKIGSGDYFHIYSLHLSFYSFHFSICPLLILQLLIHFLFKNINIIGILILKILLCYDFYIFVDMFRKLYV